MRITKHEAAVLSTALEIAKYDILDKLNSDKDVKNEAIKKLDLLQEKLNNYEVDNRLQSKSGRAYQYPSLAEIILSKIK